MEAYLDNSATTWCTEHVRDVVVKTMMEDYGNPSSKHTKGMEAEKYLRESREIIAKTLKVNEKEIFLPPAERRAITGPSLERPWPTVAPENTSSRRPLSMRQSYSPCCICRSRALR